MRWFAVFLLLLLFAQSGFARGWIPVGAGASVSKLDARSYALRISGERLNYDSTGRGDWRVVDPVIRHFDPPVFGYNYGVRCGEYWVLFPDSSDGAVAFAVKRGRHALTMKLAAAVYYSHNRDSVWVLDTADKVAGVKQGSRITYLNTLQDIDWTFEYQNDRLKSGIVVQQAARDVLPSPSVKGWTDNETWMGFTIEIKTYSFTDTGLVQIPSFTWGDSSDVWFSYADELLWFLPKDAAYLYSNPSARTTLHRRMKTVGGKDYLLVGLPYLTLENAPQGIIVFDPSPVLIGAADIVDAHVELHNPDVNYETWGALYAGCMDNKDTKHAHCFVRPDLSSIPAGVTITTALCSLYEELSYSSLDVEALEVDENWVEAEVTWNIYSTGNSWAVGGGDFSNPDDTLSFAANGSGFIAFEVENIMQAQLNGTCYGVGFRRVGNDTCVANWETPRFSSTEHATASQRPRFYIEYTLPSDQAMQPWAERPWGVKRWGFETWPIY